MLPFFLYFLTGLVTGFHVYTLLALAAYGVPTNSLELISLLGSFLLMVAAYISLFRPHAAARIALIAALLVWTFYAPALAHLVRKKITHTSVVSYPPQARTPESSRR
jgi:hypothetical protein